MASVSRTVHSDSRMTAFATAAAIAVRCFVRQLLADSRPPGPSLLPHRPPEQPWAALRDP
jgi:hypothetical protein